MQPQGWGPFLKNDSNFLWFALTCRESGIAASQRLHIKDEVLGLDLDNAVTLRLFKFDNEKEAENRRFWVALVGGKSEDDVLDSSLLGPYADENTQVL